MKYFSKMKGATRSPPPVDTYAIVPVGLGVLIMLIVALLVNNIPKNRRYPEFWF